MKCFQMFRGITERLVFVCGVIPATAKVLLLLLWPTGTAFIALALSRAPIENFVKSTTQTNKLEVIENVGLLMTEGMAVVIVTLICGKLFLTLGRWTSFMLGIGMLPIAGVLIMDMEIQMSLTICVRTVVPGISVAVIKEILTAKNVGRVATMAITVIVASISCAIASAAVTMVELVAAVVGVIPAGTVTVALGAAAWITAERTLVAVWRQRAMQLQHQQGLWQHFLHAGRNRMHPQRG